MKRKSFLFFSLVATICSCILCTSCKANTSTTEPMSNQNVEDIQLGNNQNLPKLLDAPGYSEDFRRTSINKELVPELTRTETLEKTRTERSPWWWLLGPVGLIGYYTTGSETTYIADVYTIKYYKILDVENETLFATTEQFYNGGNSSLSFSIEDITEEGIEKSITKSVNGTLGFDRYLVASVNSWKSETVTYIYKQCKSLAQSHIYGLDGFEPNRYYRIALKISYEVYEEEVRNSKGELISKSTVIHCDDNCLSLRLESRNIK